MSKGNLQNRLRRLEIDSVAHVQNFVRDGWRYVGGPGFLKVPVISPDQWERLAYVF